MLDAFLVPEKTTVTSKGDGPVVALRDSAGSVFLLTLVIVNVIAQESLNVWVHGSSDGAAWDPQPLVGFPQKGDRTEVPMLLLLSAKPDVKFIRARWEVARWKGISEPPMFEFYITLREAPMEISADAARSASAQ